MIQINLILLFCSLYDLIHRVESVLDLFHEFSFAFQSSPFIRLHFFDKTDQFLLSLIPRIFHFSFVSQHFFFHLALNSVQHGAHYLTLIVLLVTALSHNSWLFVLKRLHGLHLTLPLLFKSLIHFCFHIADLFSHHLRLSDEFSSVRLSLLSLFIDWVSYLLVWNYRLV